MRTAFAVIRTLELDVEIGDEPMVLRVELLRAQAEPRTYRARLWRRELYRMTPSFPRDEHDEPSERTDDSMFVEWSELLDGDYERFEADSDDDAQERVLDDLERALTAAAWAV
ncbi:MAG: hypothetical protein M5U28_44190 [Sandaracinaceae bacterium]|nr:hypothetical protein [Sandaracinaceae bacterium]